MLGPFISRNTWCTTVEDTDGKLRRLTTPTAPLYTSFTHTRKRYVGAGASRLTGINEQHTFGWDPFGFGHFRIFSLEGTTKLHSLLAPNCVPNASTASAARFALQVGIRLFFRIASLHGPWSLPDSPSSSESPAPSDFLSLAAVLACSRCVVIRRPWNLPASVPTVSP